MLCKSPLRRGARRAGWVFPMFGTVKRIGNVMVSKTKEQAVDHILGRNHDGE